MTRPYRAVRRDATRRAVARAAVRVPVLAPALLLALVLAVLPAGAGAPPAEANSPDPPLLRAAAAAGQADSSGPVVIETVQPSRLRPGRPVELTGTIRNPTDVAWGDVQVSMVASQGPITELEQLAAARRDPTPLLRQVLRDGDDFQDLGNIAPGGQARFSLRNAYDRLLLSGLAGVYVVGVEVRATPTDGARQEVGESTVFMPLITADSPVSPVQLAMTWPLTQRIPLTAEGYLTDTVAHSLGPQGRLDSLLSMGATATDFPLTWLVDPAVLDTAGDLADGYVLTDGTEVAEDDPRAAAAADWLGRAQTVLGRSDILTLPYGDPDLASLAHGNLVEAVAPAVEAGAHVMGDLGLRSERVLWPADGMADARTLEAGSASIPSVALLAKPTIRGLKGTKPLGLSAGRVPVTGLVYDRAAVNPRTDTMLQWRQQLLAVTAVRSLDGGGPVVAVPPRSLDPGPDWAGTDFFGELRGRWIRPTTVSTLAEPRPRTEGRLRYPDAARAAELPAENLTAIRELMSASKTLVGMLAQPRATQSTFARALGRSASLHWRGAVSNGLEATRSYVDDIRRRLDLVRLEAVPFITLSGSEGQFPLTVSNGLREPIRIGFDVRADDPAVRIERIEPITIEPEQRRTVSVRVRYPGVGITNVTVSSLAGEARPFGEPVTFKLRTTQIGTAIWAVMAVAGVLIVAASVRDVVRRVRGRRRAAVRPGDRGAG